MSCQTLEHNGDERTCRTAIDYQQGLTAIKEACLGSSERVLVGNELARAFGKGSIEILDIGSGTGVVIRKLMHDLQGRGVQPYITCVEPFPEGPWQVYQTDGMNLIVRDFDEVTFATQFDAILSIHSLYYTRSIPAAIQKLLSFLAPTGLLLIVIWEASCILYQAARILHGGCIEELPSADDVFFHICRQVGQGLVERIRFDAPLAVPFLLQSSDRLRSVASVIFRGRNARVDEEGMLRLAAYFRRARRVEVRRNSLIIVRSPLTMLRVNSNDVVPNSRA